MISPYPKAHNYLAHLDAALRSCNCPRPVGIVLSNEDYDEFYKWALQFCPYVCDSGNTFSYDGLEIRRQLPAYPPSEG